MPIKSVWGFFEQILTIPRPSKKEEKIRHFLLQFAKENQLDSTTDAAGNVLITKPASDKSNNKTVVLQSHMDMVCEKDSSVIHDFEKNPIQAEITDDWMQAKGTTLGADNGIGIAMQLAVLSDKNLSHPNIECLFTVDEETGLYGATNLDKNLLNGSILINLDTEEEGEFCIGCAGGIDTIISIEKKLEPTPEDFFFFQVELSGLQGGHSGEDINKGRANAIKILSEYLEVLALKTDIRIVEINGGNLRNAIPREAGAILAVPCTDKELVRIEINHFIAEIEDRYCNVEPSFRFDLNSSDKCDYLFTKSLSRELIHALTKCPNGPIEMHASIEKLVETSTNLAAIHTLDKTIYIETSQRSSKEKRKNDIATIISDTFKITGASIKKGKDYPGWEPNLDSNILGLCCASYKDLFKKDALVKTIHAGLECGVISKKYPTMDMISFGPTILSPHSPSEKIQVSSVEKCWELLVDVLKRI